MLGMIFFLSSLILLLFSGSVVLISFYLLLMFVMMWFIGHENMVNSLSWIFGVDSLNYMMILLSLWVFILAFLMSQPMKSEGSFNTFKFLSIVLLFFLLMSFFTVDFLIFYIFFESSLIPILIIILGWGTQPEKIQAGLYMFFYTVVGSIPLLMGFIYLNKVLGSFHIFYLIGVGSNEGMILFFCLFISFFIKLPVFGVHMWLPSAHVEAPVFGSMVLAGVMLKLGGYAMIRVMFLFLEFLSKYGCLISSFGLMGGLVSSLICLFQSDMKSLVAFSSVSHMGLFLSGLFSLSTVAVVGAFLMLVAHGFSSSGLFSLVGMVYGRVHTKSLVLVRGWLAVSPIFSMMFFILSLSNMAAPPFLNLISEVFLATGLVGVSMVFVVPLSLIFFLSAAYSLNLFSLVSHGALSTSNILNSNLNIFELLVLSLHIFPLLLLILKLDLFFFYS